MALADSVSAQIAALQAPLSAALSQAFNDGAASAQPSSGISSAQEQLDIQAAVDSAVKPLNDQISAMQLDKSKEDALLASVKSAAAALVASLG